MSEPVGAPGGGGGDIERQAYEIRSDEGFVYKVRSGLYDAAPSSSSSQPAAGPDPRVAGLRRRRRALLRLRDKRLRDLARWEALASEFLAPLPAPQPPAADAAAAASSAPILDDLLPAAAVAAASSSSASIPPVAAADASSSAASVLDDLLAQVNLLTELMRRAREWCDRANAACDAREAAMVDSIASLPLLGRNPKELMASLCSPSSGNLDKQDGHQETLGVSSEAAKMKQMDHDIPPPILTESRKKASGSISTALDTPVSTKRRKEDYTPATPEASGVSSTAAKKIQDSIKKQKVGHGLPPILTESRLRKRVHHPSGSNVISQASTEPKRKKVSGSTTAPGTRTPGSTRRKANSTAARAPFIVGSPGALTSGSRRRRRREEDKIESLGDLR